jgi:lysozyme
MAIDMARLQRRLAAKEDKRNKPYKDTEGKLTIGIGRNLDDKGLKDSEIAFLLANDIDDAITDAIAVVHRYQSLDGVRQEVVIEMAFNLGRARLAGFKKMLAAIGNQQFDLAATEMLDSKWAKQVKGRAQELAKAMRTGTWG